MAGTPSTMGLTTRKNEIANEDGLLVKKLRAAGAIVLGKTNVSQLMFCHESENPLYGQTKNPWDATRSPGGSSGGEAAIIAAGGSPLGLGSDLGGSIRQPCHACGIQGIKPTGGRVPRAGLFAALSGMEAISLQPGPMARRVEDLDVALRALAAPLEGQRNCNVSSIPLLDPAEVDVASLRVAMWTDDGYFPPSVAISRAVHEAAEILRSRGATVESFEPPRIDEMLELFVSLISADGGRGMRRLLSGSKVDWRVPRMLFPARIPRLLQPLVLGLFHMFGQYRSCPIIASGYGRSADEYWQLIVACNQYLQRFFLELDRGEFDVMIFPPHALPAMPHNTSPYMLPAASYCFLANLLDIPAGVVTATRVMEHEETGRQVSRDMIDQLARRADENSAKLPVGVQVAARHWREDIVLAVMQTLEEAFRKDAEYPSVAEL